MNGAHTQPRAGEITRRQGPTDSNADCYHGVELAPTTLESLVTWDVSVHAQREKDRLNPAPPGVKPL